MPDARVSPLLFYPFLLYLIAALHLYQNLIQRTPVAPDMFACLYRGQGLYLLQISYGNGSTVNPTMAGITLSNNTLCQTILPHGAGEEYYFVLSQTDKYSLKLEGVEVWARGEPDPLPETSEVSLFQYF